MNRWVQWAYATGLFLLMGSVAGAGFYQYKDNLSIPYNINLFNCVATPLATSVSCTSMTLQDSSGNEILTVTRPGIVQLNSSPTSVGIGDGANASQGAKADAAATDGFSASSIISLLKGILNNVVTPITVSGNITTTPAATPQSSVVANQPTVNAVITGSPQNVTVANTPTVSVVSPLGVAVVNNVAVTTPTPLQVTTASPLGAAVVNNVAVTPPTPLNVTVGSSPVAVSIASSPVNVTGTFTASSSSPTTVNLNQVAGNQISSPTTYGVAPVGSVAGVNAFVTSLPASPLSVGIAQTPLNVTVGNVASPAGVAVVNNVAVTPPSPLAVTLPSSPISVGISASPLDVAIFGPTPLAVTLPASPLTIALSTAASPMSVGISSGSSPLNVTGTFTSASPSTVNLNQVAGNQISSPTTYGVAPVGSVLGTNAFVTNNVLVTPPTPLQITLPASPVSVGLPATPLNVTVGNTASPAGVAVVNAPTVVLSGSPVSVGITAGSSPLNVTTPSPLNVTGSLTANVSSPIGVNIASSPVQVTLPASPVSVGLSGSPVSVGIATGSSPLNVTGNFNTTVSSPLGVVPFNGASPQNVTLNTSPVSVAISTVSSPINVTGNISTTISSPAAMNLTQVQNQTVASPSTYGVAPVGSVAGVNAFVTNNVSVTTPTPLQVTLPASPISVGISATPLNVTVNNSPVAVSIASSPVNVTGNFTSSSPSTFNLAQVQGWNIASPTTYGVAPVGSVAGVNAFITNSPTVVLSGSPVSVGIAGPTPLNVTVSGSPQNMTMTASPVGVGVANNVSVTPPTPLQITLPASPISVGIAGPSPLGVTITSSPVAMNEVQRQGVNLASPSTYGVAPVGSVGGVNAFVTNNVAVTTPTPLQVTLPASPVSVGVANTVNVTTPTPLQVTMPASPLSVAIAGPTPLAVTLPSTPVEVAISTVSSPINVTGNLSTTPPAIQTVNVASLQSQNLASPSTYGVAPVGSVQGVNSFVTNNVSVTTPTPLQITLPASPVSVGLSASPAGVAVVNSPTVTLSGTPISVVQVQSPQSVSVTNSPVAVSIASSPINVTGNFTSSSPQTVNLGQVQNVNIASPSTYGVAPVGSTLGVNAFVTNNVNVTTPTPLQVTLPASPLSVGIAGPSPLNVTVGGIVSPQGVTIASSPVAVNEVQRQGVNLASPSTYGVAPVGSVGGVNAFVTNNVAVTTPTPLQVTLPASPISVAIAGPTPLAVTLPSTPVEVAISSVSSPINITGSITANSASPTTTNLSQVQGWNVASPTTYGVAPIGSVQGVNAFITSLPATPLNVTVGGIVSPQNMTLAGPSPLNVTVGSPQNVTLVNSPVAVTISSSPVNVTINDLAGPVSQNVASWQSITVASPSTYGVAPVGSTPGVNAFVTNGNPNGSNTMANSQPVVVATDQTPISVNILAGGATNTNVIAWVPTTAFNVTNTVIALGATPGLVGVHQLNSVGCSGPVAPTTPAAVYLQIFDTAAHASGSDVALGTTLPKRVVTLSGTPATQSIISDPYGAPGAEFQKGISIAFTTTAKGPTATNVFVTCSFTYN